MNLLLHIMLGMLALPAATASLYLLTATLLSRALPSGAQSSRIQRFDIIVPAHNEAAQIESVVTGLQKIDWPVALFRIVVVADNCTDATAARARDAGARVLERLDPQSRGKGFALEFAFHRSLALGWADAVVVVDADSEVSANLLEVFSACLEAGAQAVQARYGVLNPDDSWRTRLSAIALAAFHDVRSRAREHLGLSCGLRGNGWCITTRLLHGVPHQAVSLAEDVEYGIALGIRGYRVQYADCARVSALMPGDGADARSQRRRWEDGRFQLARVKLPPLLRAAYLRRDLVCADLALDLLVLPVSYVALNVVVLLALAELTAILTNGVGTGVWLWLGVACALSLALYVLRGWQLSQTGLRGLIALGAAPFFVVWKLALMLRVHNSTEWVRTRRRSS